MFARFVEAFPFTPLVAVNWAKFTLVIGPSVPNRSVLGELVVDVGGAAEEPEELS